MRSVTAQGSPVTRLRRAILGGNASIALAAAREMPRVGLDDALALCLLLLDHEPARYERAGVRWAGRVALEIRGVTLGELQLAVTALAALQGPGAEVGARTLAALSEGSWRMPAAADALERWAEWRSA